MEGSAESYGVGSDHSTEVIEHLIRILRYLQDSAWNPHDKIVEVKLGDPLNWVQRSDPHVSAYCESEGTHRFSGAARRLVYGHSKDILRHRVKSSRGNLRTGEHAVGDGASGKEIRLASTHRLRWIHLPQPTL